MSLSSLDRMQWIATVKISNRFIYKINLLPNRYATEMDARKVIPY